MAYTNKAHAERRARIEAERAERRRLEEEERERRRKKKKSQSTYAKWYWKGGIRIGGVAVRGGKYYAGCNMANLVEPHLKEPSLLDPSAEGGVAESSAGMTPVNAYPVFSTLSPEQRRGYIEFLASDRSSATDIGFVFLYLAGLERRLIVDAAKPGEVGEEEHEDLVRELVRLVNVFANKSRSICHYIGMLLLYDGKIFDLMTRGEIERFFGFGNNGDPRRMKLHERSDNADAMSYLLVSRIAEKGWDVPIDELCCAAKGRLLRSQNAAMLGLDEDALYDRAFDAIFHERVLNMDLKKAKDTSPRRISEPARPVYYPASFFLRKDKTILVTPDICPDPESLGIPLRKLSDVALSCFKDLEKCQSVITSSSLRDIDELAFDAVLAVSPEKCALAEYLAGKDGATRVPMQLVKDDLRRRFGYSLQYTSKGTLSTVSQHVIAIVAASLGWQAVLPETIEGLPASYWRVKQKNKIVFFKRGVAHDRRNGRRCLGQVFGSDESSIKIVLPGVWNDAAALAFVFAWFVGRCPDSLSTQSLSDFTAACMPPWSDDLIRRKNQIYLFFAVLHATYQMELSTHGIKACLSSVPFDKVKNVLFSLVNDKFGNNIPHDVMEALEDIYIKAGADKTMVLYDYHAGSYHVSHAGSEMEGFAIDEERLASTIADTSNVHVILNEAMGSDDTLDLEPAGNEEELAPVDEPSEKTSDEEALTPVKGASSSTDAMEKIVEVAFDGDDEMASSDLLASIMEQVGLATSAQAMSWIARFNELLGEERVEIDGADAYLN